MKPFAFALLSLFLFAAITTVVCDDDDDDERGLGAAASTLVDVLQFRLQYTRKTALWKKAVKAVYNLTVYPYNEIYIKGGALPNVLASNICGRVHPFGKHCGAIDVAEYFYGLTPNNITFDVFPSQFILEVLMTRFFIDLDTKTAFSTINYVVGPLNRAYTLNATQVGTFRFDNQDKIVEFDLWNPLYSTNTRRGINYQNPVYQNTLFNQTCDRHRRFCTGANQQYDSVDTCINFLKSIPFGEPDVFTANNVLCRHQHATLVSLRPEIHCPHIGPTGGDFCKDQAYNDYFQVPYFADKNRLVAPMVAY